ncbi:MAG: CPBP family intramembrane metalloprotease [Cytophagales bacterium]|nr:CPBP family intramembrane metalloprotease [Cytophagales bacterium]
MPHTSSEPRASANRHPVVSVLALLCFIVFGLVLGELLALLVLLPFFQFSWASAEHFLRTFSVYEAQALPLYLMQGASAIALFLVVPWIQLRFVEKRPLSGFFQRLPSWLELGLTLALALCFMFSLPPVIEWNKGLHLPAFLADTESWMRLMEDRAQQLTDLLTSFTDWPTLLLALLVMSVLPGVGEELLFRGLIQNYIHQATRNPHVGIWVSAFLFGFFIFSFWLNPTHVAGGAFWLSLFL